jgi:N-acetylneuraminic acid mutarotase
MIVWGGYGVSWVVVNTGGVFDPATDTWSATSTTDAPTRRAGHTAVWTGSRMVVWGGTDDVYFAVRFNTGGLYDPAANTWTPMSTTNAPTARIYPTAVWTGSKMVVWGGSDGSWTNTGGVYDPATDTWTATSTTNAPTARFGHSAVWTGSKMIVWGGVDGATGLVNTGGLYDPATDSWTAMSTTNAPSGRETQTAIWSGTRMVVWGGLEGSSGTRTNTGGVYDPVTDTWTATSTTNAPTARQGHTAVWTGSNMVVWGGRDISGVVNTGGLYSNPVLVPPLPSPADFYTVTPCRLVDTRNSAGPAGGPALVAGAVRRFPATGGVCGVPTTATAVSVTLTVTQPTAQGYLALYPGDAAGPPLVSNINFVPGVTRATNAVVLLARNGGTVNVKNGSAGSVHIVLDVNGYFE